MSRKGLMEQDLNKLDVTKLHPLSPEVISRQATINIGNNFPLILGFNYQFCYSYIRTWSNFYVSFFSVDDCYCLWLMSNKLYYGRHHRSCGTWKINSCESNIGCSGIPLSNFCGGVGVRMEVFRLERFFVKELFKLTWLVSSFTGKKVCTHCCNSKRLYFTQSK